MVSEWRCTPWTVLCMHRSAPCSVRCTVLAPGEHTPRHRGGWDARSWPRGCGRGAVGPCPARNARSQRCPPRGAGPGPLPPCARAARPPPPPRRGALWDTNKVPGRRGARELGPAGISSPLPPLPRPRPVCSARRRVHAHPRARPRGGGALARAPPPPPARPPEGEAAAASSSSLSSSASPHPPLHPGSPSWPRRGPGAATDRGARPPRARPGLHRPAGNGGARPGLGAGGVGGGRWFPQRRGAGPSPSARPPAPCTRVSRGGCVCVCV